MSFLTASQWGPLTTPSTIKRLIIFTILASILSAAIQTIVEQFELTPGPQELFSLSWWGIGQFYLWQFATFLFIQPHSSAGITFSSLITLFFNMYLLWAVGTTVYEQIGKASFLRFYFICGIGAGLITLLTMPLIGQYAMLAGPTPAILAILTAWSMLYPESEVLLFFLFPVKVKWLMAGLIAIIFLTSLTQWDLVSFFFSLTAILIGYLYATLAWGWQSPFSQTRPIDAYLAKTGLKLRQHTAFLQRFKKHSNKVDSKETKVIDIDTGAPLSNDDAFIDQMLAKISQHGEGSLSWSERRRMQQISLRKKQESDERRM